MIILEQGKTNWKYILIVVVLAFIIGGGILNWGMTEGKEILNPLKAQPGDLIKSLFQWVWFLISVAIPIFIGFLIPYFLFLLGLKVLKIEGIPRFKIMIYIFVMFLVATLLNTVFIRLADVLNKPSLYLINILVSVGITLSLLKYYFSLSGKKLWQFFLYLTALGLVFSGLSSLLKLL